MDALLVRLLTPRRARAHASCALSYGFSSSFPKQKPRAHARAKHRRYLRLWHQESRSPDPGKRPHLP